MSSSSRCSGVAKATSPTGVGVAVGTTVGVIGARVGCVAVPAVGDRPTSTVSLSATADGSSAARHPESKAASRAIETSNASVLVSLIMIQHLTIETLESTMRLTESSYAVPNT